MSVEHAYQSVKAHFHGEEDLAQRVQCCPTGAAAKTMTRSIKTTPEWHAGKEDLMRRLLWCK